MSITGNKIDLSELADKVFKVLEKVYKLEEKVRQLQSSSANKEEKEKQPSSDCCHRGSRQITEEVNTLALRKIYGMLKDERIRLNVIVAQRSLNYTPQEYAGIISASARLEICEELIGTIDAKNYHHATK